MTSSSHYQTLSSSSSTSHSSRWDVFLSFRGKDTRCTFTGHLYHALSRIGILTFMDDPELTSGEVIREALVQAVQESKTYVVVFSENYASSSWCLDELVEILKCHKSMGRLVIPVFYNIEPAVVRHQINKFGEDLYDHQVLYGVDKEKLINWRHTLTEVANLSGEHIDEQRSEADIVSKVVDRVLGELNPKILDITKYPVGLDSRVRDITAKMISDTQRVTKIGIYGMGGIGKTTLAKAVYNQNYHQFQGSSFLANVREDSKTEQGLLCLQQQLINNVLKCTKHKIDNVHHGITCIKKRLCSIKVLIVIDDLDGPEPLEYLGPLALGSIIIITTRNEDLLDSVEVEAKYKVSELDYAESRQLFTKHAFGDKIISDSLMKFSDEILEHAGGLPLALKVFGSNLINRSDEGYWRWFVDESIKVSITKVEEDLLISYHGLKSDHPMLQDIFLDIACFFMGQEEEEVAKLMETCYISVSRYIDILKKRCLLTINERDELGMHHLLRDMGREIARNKSLEPGKHSRLWVLDDICNVLKKNKGTKAIEGIIPHNLEYQNALDGLSFATKVFKKMRKLRFLYLEKVDLTGSFRQTFDFLRLFHWKSCPLKYLPSEFYPHKLVILELPYSKMRTMWEPNMVSPVLKELKILNMSYSLDLNTTPDFTKLPCLEILNLEGCKSLEEFHIPTESLACLVSLNLCYCVNLRSLPDTITNLTALQVLSIDHCGSLKVLPEDLGKIELLKKLNAKKLTVSKIPDSIKNFSQLVELKLSSNEDLETLPDTICNLVSLEILDISKCTKLRKVTRSQEQDASAADLLRLPDSESSQNWSLRQESLDLKDSPSLLYIAKFPPNLRQIKADGCASLESLPNLSNLKHLENLDLTDCKCLTEIHGLEELTSIRKIQLAGCNSSLLASIFTKRLFQLFSEMGNQIEIYIRSDMFPDWISQSSNLNSTTSIDVLSEKYLGMILCFKYLGDFAMIDYTIQTATSEFIWKDSINTPDRYESLMVILPRSMFSVRDADHRIELTTETAEIYGIHLLYKREITKIDQYDNTAVNVEKERSYPSKRLKL